MNNPITKEEMDTFFVDMQSFMEASYGIIPLLADYQASLEPSSDLNRRDELDGPLGVLDTFNNALDRLTETSAKLLVKVGAEVPSEED